MLAINAANYYSIITIMLIYQSVYPYLIVLMLLYSLIRHYQEKYMITKLCLIRK